MFKSSLLKASTFPLNTNLQPIEQDAVGKYPFVVLLESETTTKLLKLNENLKALGKDPIDTNQLINEALASKLDGLLFRNVHPNETREALNNRHLTQPKVGDVWSERPGTHYLRVVAVLGDDDFILHTYVSAGTGLMPGRYRANREVLGQFVCYDWPTARVIEGSLPERAFCADVTVLPDDHESLRELLQKENIANELKYCTDARHVAVSE